MSHQKLNAIISGSLLLLYLIINQFLDQPVIGQILLIIAAITSGLPILWHALQALRFRVMSIELLVSIAVIGALFLHEFWEAAAVSFLFIFGAYLEARTLSKTRSSLETMIRLSPLTAVRLIHGVSETVDVDELVVGDTVIVKTGDRIPVDGIIVRGIASVNQSSITGETLSAEKTIGSEVYGTTIVENGYLEILTKRVGEETTYGQLMHLLEEAQEAKAPTQKFIEKFASYYTPTMIMAAIIVFMVTRDIRLALTLLVISCPGAMVISIPVAIVAGIGQAAKFGILIKGGEFLEKAAKVEIIAFDKTGTLTVGLPEVNDVIAFSTSEKEVIRVAAQAEMGSEHHLAKAIINEAVKQGIVSDQQTEYKIFPGKGLVSTSVDETILVGNLRLAEENGIAINKVQLEEFTAMQSRTATAVMVALNGILIGYIGITDKLRNNTLQSLQQLKNEGIQRLVVLTGDTYVSAQRTLSQLPIDEINAELLPIEKAATVRQLKQSGVTAMVGDGVNDTLALAESDIGIAMGKGATDAAIKTADIVILNEKTVHLVELFRISRLTVTIMKQNILFSVSVVFLLLIGVLTKTVHMDLGMMVHELSVLAVILNAMRITGKHDIIN